jgi:hypothetical protein
VNGGKFKNPPGDPMTLGNIQIIDRAVGVRAA